MNVHHTPHSPHKPVGKHPDRSASPRNRVPARPTEEPPDSATGGFSAILRRYPLSLGVTALAGCVLLSALCMVAYNSPDPSAWMPVCSAAALLLTSFCGGLAAGRLNPLSPVAAGFLYGAFAVAFLVVAALALEGDSTLMPWLLRLSPLPLHGLGSLVTRPRSVKNTHTGGTHSSRR